MAAGAGAGGGTVKRLEDVLGLKVLHIQGSRAMPLASKTTTNSIKEATFFKSSFPWVFIKDSTP
jgi:hypothetical protein